MKKGDVVEDRKTGRVGYVVETHSPEVKVHWFDTDEEVLVQESDLEILEKEEEEAEPDEIVIVDV